jgi:hypothetical protein
LRLFLLSIIAILLGFMPTSFGALDLDTKFTARVLGVSDTKRTLLVNRGIEHGLVLDQHAKVSLTTGLVARAVVVRLAPSRSVWSIYRFYAKDKVTPKTVYTFKISSPIELTTDESKAIGSLADKVEKKTEEVPQDPKSQEKQKEIMKSIITSEKIVSQYDSVDYSKLNESGMEVKKSPKRDDIDWSGLNGKKDAESFDASLDYSSLR